jgi:hypothetical protein
MSERRLAYVAISLVASFLSDVASATQGPLQAPLRVTQMDTVDNGGGPLYVAFQTGAMPDAMATRAGICIQRTASTRNCTLSS